MLSKLALRLRQQTIRTANNKNGLAHLTGLTTKIMEMEMSYINIEAMASAEYTRSTVVQLEGYYIELNEPNEPSAPKAPKAKNTKQDLTKHYQRQKNLKAKIYDHDELICTYNTKNFIKAVFITDELDRATFKRFIQMKNELGADKVVVHCMYAYLASDNLEVILNRAE